MKYLALLLTLLLMLVAAPLHAADILIVQSMRDPGFSEVLRGFSATCGASSKTLVLSDYVDVDMARVVREEQPALVVTLGESALASVKKLRRVPVLALMSLSISMGRPAPANVAGIGMVASPDRYLTIFTSLKARRIGVIYNPSRSGGYLHRARRVLERAGVDLVALETHDPRDTPKLLASLKGRVDALWLLPDTTAVTPATTEAFFYFSMDQWKPVVAFSSAYLAMGAAAVLDVDRFELGRQSGQLARRMLDGASPAEISLQDPAGVVVKKNQRITEKLRIKLHDQE